ncbi:hypothetical protein AB7254_01235 [Providencia rettgeri]
MNFRIVCDKTKVINISILMSNSNFLRTRQECPFHQVCAKTGIPLIQFYRQQQLALKSEVISA